MSGNTFNHSVQNLLSSVLLSKNIKIKIYRIIVLPVVLYGCETWSLTSKEECRLRVFENRVLRRIFGPKRDEVTGEWRKLHNEELNELYSSPNIIRVIKLRIMRWAGNVAGMGKRRSAYAFVVRKSEGKRPLGRHRNGWEDNIKMDLQEVGWDLDWIGLAQNKDSRRAVANAVMAVMILCVSQYARNFLTSLEPVKFHEGFCTTGKGSLLQK